MIYLLELGIAVAALTTYFNKLLGILYPLLQESKAESLNLSGNKFNKLFEASLDF